MSAEAVAPASPDWDMTPYFDAFDGDDYQAFRQALARDVEALQREVDDLGGLASDPHEDWVALLVRLEDLSSRTAHLAGYLGCLSAADARNEDVSRENASAAAARADYEKIFVSVRAHLGDASDEDFAALVDAPELADATWFLARLRRSARERMEPDLEALAADLGVTGIQAWGRLYDQISGRLEFDLELPGCPPRPTPVAVTRSLLEDPDANVRRAALGLWPLPVAAVITALAVAIAVVAVWGSQADDSVASAQPQLEAPWDDFAIADPADARLAEVQRRLSLSYEGIEIMARAERWWRFDGSGVNPAAAGTLAYSEEFGAACLLVLGLAEGDQFVYQARLTDAGGQVSLHQMWRFNNSLWLVLEGNPTELQKLEIILFTTGSLPPSEIPAVITIPLKST